MRIYVKTALKLAAFAAALVLGAQAFAYNANNSGGQTASNNVINLGDYATNYGNGNLGGVIPDIHMAPGSVYIIQNPISIFWVWVYCTISTTGTQPIFAKMQSGSASVNGVSLNTTGTTFNATNGMSLTLHAGPKAEVYLRNDGNAEVSATCKL